MNNNAYDMLRVNSPARVGLFVLITPKSMLSSSKFMLSLSKYIKKNLRNLLKKTINYQLRSSRENLHLLSVKPVQILQASSRAKRQLSIINYQLSWSACRFATTHRAEVKGEAFAKISSVVALQARSDKRKSESLGGKSNRVETKSKSLETYYFYAIRFFFYAFLTFF